MKRRLNKGQGTMGFDIPKEVSEQLLQEVEVKQPLDECYGYCGDCIHFNKTRSGSVCMLVGKPKGILDYCSKFEKELKS